MTFLCPTCGKSFGSKDKLRGHNQIHSEKIFTCKICDKTLNGKKSFNNHIRIHQTYECTLCEATIKSNSRSSHMKICSNVERKKFSCTECPYFVDRRDRLKTHHEKKHSKSVTSRFQCTYCQKKFRKRSRLKDHEKTHVTLRVQNKDFYVMFATKVLRVKKVCMCIITTIIATQE